MKRTIKSIIPFLVVLGIVVFMMDFGNGKIEYEQVTYESLPENLKQNLLELGPGGTGMFEYKGHSYAFIATSPEEKAEIELVGDAEIGPGLEVKYNVIERKEDSPAKIINGMQGEYGLSVIRLERIISTPFGFNQLNR